MTKNLLIVESPAKAKTIEKYLGKDFKVMSSFGHVRDLAKKNDAIDIEDGYKPNYIIPEEKKKVVAELKKIAKDAETVWLATDEDREGEAISWHLCEVLNLDPLETKRIVFHEITKEAILKAVSKPRTLDLNLVNAQQARRILDRLVGFELSPLLWRKVSKGSSLSAGRVQSVAVRLIVEREAEIEAHQSQSQFRIQAFFLVPDADGKMRELKAEASKRFDQEEEAHAFLKDCIGAAFQITDIQVKPAKRSPAAPFTTSTLQQEASRKLSFSVARTMAVAQKLYENGHITYMRTDSLNLSETALDLAAKAISDRYGKKYSKPQRYKTKNSGAQEAHEAIRPTDMTLDQIGIGGDEERLYKLIWQRTIASQMADAEFERTTVRINISTRPEELAAKGEVVIFDGFLKVYAEGTDEEPSEEMEGLLPPLKLNQALQLDKMNATERFSKPAARYTEASLVRKLEELGIGRPSTYAPTISTIQKREYVVKGDREGEVRPYQVLELSGKGAIERRTETEVTGKEKAKLFPTDIAILVNSFLTEHFAQVLDYHFTARIEKQFDEIAEGETDWTKMIDGFYRPFHKHIQETMETAERVTGQRLLGPDPKSGKPVYARMGRYGPMVQVGETEDEEKPRFAKIVGELSLQTITLEQAMNLLALPRTLGTFRDDDLVIGSGRFGPYVRNAGKFYSIPRDEDPRTVTEERALEIIEAKEESDRQKFIMAFDEHDIQVLNGRWGPYIKQGKNNYKIPKDVDPATLTLEQCQEIISAPPKARSPRKKAKNA
ncbi:MAG: type I DNA topoisomerase [Bacteroidetes bacterium]|nr:type I DNA topoisomerase [Bacteroidota bacterium]